MPSSVHWLSLVKIGIFFVQCSATEFFEPIAGPNDLKNPKQSLFESGSGPVDSIEKVHPAGWTYFRWMAPKWLTSFTLFTALTVEGLILAPFCTALSWAEEYIGRWISVSYRSGNDRYVKAVFLKRCLTYLLFIVNAYLRRPSLSQTLYTPYNFVLALLLSRSFGAPLEQHPLQCGLCKAYS